MKKLLSILLVGMLMLSTIPIIAQAESAYTFEFEGQSITNFDGDQAHMYNSSTSRKYTSYTELVANGDEAHNNVLNYPKISGTSQNLEAGTRLVNTAGNDIYNLVAGMNYTVSFDIKVESAPKNFTVGIAGIASNHGLENLPTIDSLTQKAALYSVTAGTTSDWVNVKQSFTSNASGYATILVYNTDEANHTSGARILLDNIVIESGFKSAKITFDDDQTSVYVPQSSRNMAYVDIVADEDTARGNVLKYKNVAGRGKEWAPNTNFVNANYNGFRVVKDVEYSITFDMKTVTLPTANATVAVGISDLPNGNGNIGSVQNLTRYDLRTVSSTSDWVKIRKTFVAGKTGYLVLVVYKYEEWNPVENADIRFDNLFVEPTNYDSTYVTFDTDEQYNYYNGLDKTGVANMQVYDTGEEGHGKVAKFTSIAGQYSSKWPQSMRLCTSDGNSTFRIKKGESYQIECDVKAANATDSFMLGVVFSTTQGCSNLGIYGDYGANKGYINWYNKDNKNWVHATATITATIDSDPVLLFFGNELNNQEIYLDNISISRIPYDCSVTYHFNNGADDLTERAVSGTSFKTATLDGAEFDGWYLDENLTNPVSVIPGDCSVYAKWKTATMDFDNLSAKALYSAFKVVNNNGIDNSDGFTNVSEKLNSNSSWPDRFSLVNPDGTNFTVKYGNSYTVKLYVKATNPSAVGNIDSIFLADSSAGLADNGASVDDHIYINEDYQTQTLKLKPFYDANGTNFGGFAPMEFTIVPNEDQNNKPVYVTAWCCGSFVIFDNITIRNNGAVKTVTAGENTYKGYAGEPLKIAEPETEDGTNFVWWSETDNDPAYNSDIITKDVELTQVNSQLAVIDAKADAESNSLDFTARCSGIDYTLNSENGDIELSDIDINGEKSEISEIGLLVAPENRLNGQALTLDNCSAVGARKISNGNLKYAATNGDNGFDITASVSFGESSAKYDREYAVVTYVKYGADSVLYSKTKYTVDQSYVKAMGLTSVSADLYSKNGYNLSYNSEFNGDENITDNWDYWLGSLTNNDIQIYGVTKENLAEQKDGNLVVKCNKNTDTTAEFAELLSKKRFTHGYFEARIKASGEGESGFAWWLNSAGINEDLFAVKPTNTTKYVYPEIDIVEIFSGANNQTRLTVHNWDFSANPIAQKQTVVGDYNCTTSEWHTYGLERTSDQIVLYIDGTEYGRITKTEILNKNMMNADEVTALFDNPVYMRLGTSMNSLQAPQTVEAQIDYVRVYE